MKCSQCGSELAAGAVFCQQCGKRVAAAPAAAVPPPVDQGSPSAGRPADAFGGSANRRGGGKDSPEQTLWEGGYSAKAMVSTWLAAAVFSVILLVAAIYVGSIGAWWWWILLIAIVVLWVVLAVRWLLMRMAVHYKLTNQRFFHEQGILRRVTNRIEVIDIDDISFEQGIVDRFFGVGRIKVTSSDRTDPELWLEGIDNVQEVATMLDAARRAERVRRGLYVEAI